MTKSVKGNISVDKADWNCKGKRRLVTAILVLSIFLFNPNIGIAQADQTIYKLSLAEAVEFAKSQNKSVQAANIEEQAVGEDRKDAFNNGLPTINVGSSYQRFSDLTLFTDGLSHATSGPRKPTPNSANAGVDVLFNIYGGGRQRALQKEQSSKLKFAKLNARDISGSEGLQTASQYLEMVRLIEQQKFIADQLKRAQTRLSNINSLYKNQKVTKSDVLRAEVALSNVELSMQQNENDIAISNQKLNLLINVPETVIISPVDSAGMPKPDILSLLPLVESAKVSSIGVQKAGESVEVQQARLKGIKSANLPNLSFYGGYGLNYPNYLFFPPVNQAYAVGFVGLKLQYSISSLYQNKRKVTAGELRVKELQIQQEAFSDHVGIEIKSYYIKYREALTRISVNEKSVEQARVNYAIVNTKYLNQLSLLTDLLDADNLYQESRLNLVKAQTDSMVIYYHILYTSGNL
jgi:outer membrane protein TolC